MPSSRRLRAAGKNTKQWRQLLREAEEAGWSWERRANGNHIRLRRGEQTLSLSLGAGDGRAFKNMRARLKRAEDGHREERHIR